MQSFDARHQIAEATGTAWIPHLTSAALRRDMRSHALHGSGLSGALDFVGDVGLILSEAIAERSMAGWFLLPHTLAHVVRGKRSPCLRKIDDRACRVWTEAVRGVLVAGQRCVG
jgi:hypothetical protein